MPLKTSREQKARTHRFLLSPEALSSCKVSTGGKGLAGMGSSGEGRRESKQISDPSNIAVVKIDCFSPLENNWRYEFLGRPSKSRNNCAMEPMVWFESVGKISIS